MMALASMARPNRQAGPRAGATVQLSASRCFEQNPGAPVSDMWPSRSPAHRTWRFELDYGQTSVAEIKPENFRRNQVIACGAEPPLPGMAGFILGLK
jgi:hypothetical protein